MAFEFRGNGGRFMTWRTTKSMIVINIKLAGLKSTWGILLRSGEKELLGSERMNLTLTPKQSVIKGYVVNYYLQ